MNDRTRRFFSYYGPYKRLLAGDVFCAMASAGISVLLPLCVRHITNDLIESGLPDAANRVLLTGGLMAILIALQGMCIHFFDYRGHAMGAMMERDMRRELFAHYQALSFRFHDDQRVGRLMARITNDLLSLAELYHHGPENIAVYAVRFVGAFIVLSGINSGLLLIVLAFLPPLALLTFFTGRRMYAAQEENLERIGEVNARVEEGLSGIRVVKAYAGEGVETQRFGEANERFLEGRKAIYRNEANFSVIVESFASLITAAIAVFGGVRILGQSLAVPDLITFILYIGYLVEPVQRLAFLIKQYQEGVAGFNRFMDIMEVEPEIRDAAGAVDIQAPRGEITFDGVAFRYREDRDYVLRGLSFSVKAGEHVAVVGHSGVGKTTLCALIPRFYEVGEGRILLDGIDIRDIRLDSLRRQIGVVEQDVYLFSGTVRENIRYGKPDATDEEIERAAMRADAHGFITDWPQGYETDIGQRGVRLSGGQRQRISIARAFLKNPPVLILDEATSSLDTQSERAVQRSLEALSAGRTTFIIAHRLSTVKSADRIFVLSDEGIIEQGTHDELMAKDGAYAQLYKG